MDIVIKSDGTTPGTRLEVDGETVRHIQALSFIGSTVDGFHLELRYWGEKDAVLKQLEAHPMISLAAFDETTAGKLRDCASAWRQIRFVLPAMINASSEPADEIKIAHDYCEYLDKMLLGT